ncbi:MAG: hypothetical protein IIY30_03480 [Erysipelotrichaceae bacterium]|nr:hypothetical protein [Erysipelotrichaceae bacterium]MBQ1322831.1 hypothetical protein [Erysipelotrichaceae bacterium]MBQ1776199.1 hypothetical protein [Erysipelotrichaceae bacterium]MBQ2233342.1 hypothetical protein [Erysipelotrichaceae bacterium]MBQ3994797.1 hypothetical protein [Erysipelotrichaceae bacterium]
MELIWLLLNEFEISSDKRKKRLFLLCNTIAFLLIGALVAFVVNLIHPISIDWIICITAYIACGVGYIGGIFFLYKKG